MATTPLTRLRGVRFAVLAAAVLSLACFNLSYRLGQEAVNEWDEALYAVSAWESVTSGQWIATTFMGEIDYYNTKPPLNIWLIKLAFKAFGANLISLRMASAAAAWLTVLVLLVWTRRKFGAAVSLLSSLVLATTFGFIYIHAGRSANTDALFALLVLLTVVTLVAEDTQPWHRVLLGPILAGVFLLRGMAILMPLTIVAIVLIAGRRQARRRPWLPSGLAALLFLLPVGSWAIARYWFDRWEFFSRLVGYDFVERSVRSIEGHGGGPLYYLDILQRHQYDWLAAAALALLLHPIPRARILAALSRWRDDRLTLTLVAWGTATLLVPTLMQTKLSWYLNPFYPLFALGVGAALSRALGALGAVSRPRLVALTVAAPVVLGVAEARLLWYSFNYRDLSLSEQGLLMAERSSLAGARLLLSEFNRSGIFVASAVVGAVPERLPEACCLASGSRAGDYLLLEVEAPAAQFELVQSRGSHRLYRRRDD
jgi:4-amino-4-deoxy-L-arabinose transferase-like glycosyltransferase